MILAALTGLAVDAAEAIQKRRLAVAAFAVATIYVPGIFSSAYMPRWWAIAVLVPLASDLDPRKLDPEVGLCLVAGVAFAALSLFWTPIPAEGAMEVAFLALLAMVMVAAAGAEPEDFDRALHAFAWGISISCAAALWQWSGRTLPVPFDVPANGASGFFFNPEVLAEVAAPAAVLAFWRRRWVLAGLLAAPLVVGLSRTAPAALLAGLWFGWSPRSRWAKPAAVAVLIVAGLIVVAWPGAMGVDKVSSALTRAVLWTTGILWITPFGQGMGWWPVAFPGTFQEFAHSDVLQLAVELGLGALPLLAVPVIVVARGEGDVAARSAFVALALEAAVSFPLHAPATAFLAAVLAGGMARRRGGLRDGGLARGAKAVLDLRRQVSLGDAVVRDVPGHAEGVPVRARASQDGDLGAAGVRREALAGDRIR